MVGRAAIPLKRRRTPRDYNVSNCDSASSEASILIPFLATSQSLKIRSCMIFLIIAHGAASQFYDGAASHFWASQQHSNPCFGLSLLRQSDYHHNVAYSIYMITNNIKAFYADLMSDGFGCTYRIELLKIS